MQSARRVVYATAAGAGMLMGVLLPPPGLAASGAEVPPNGPTSQKWHRERSSASADPGRIVGRHQGAQTVSYVRDGGDRPEFGTIEVGSGPAAEDTIAELQGDPELLAVGIDTGGLRALGATSGPRAGNPETDLRAKSAIATDPRRPEQWALDQVRAESAWDWSTGAGVTVAVLDSGVAPHPDLAGSIVPGVDFVLPGGNGRADGDGHGTGMAGIIAMTPNNGIGGAGVAPGVNIMPVRILDDNGAGSIGVLGSAATWATDHGARVINMSFGDSGNGSQAVRQVAGVGLQYALDRGVVLVAAVGNEYCDEGTGGPYPDDCVKWNPSAFPATYPGVIGVSASTVYGESAWYANAGLQVDVTAPGGDEAAPILHPTNEGYYDVGQGTSEATPIVAAAAAQLLGRAAALGTSVNVPAVLAATATDTGDVGRDDLFGAGLVNPVAALSSIQAPPPPPPAAPAPAAPAPPAVAAAPAVQSIRVPAAIRNGKLRRNKGRKLPTRTSQGGAMRWTARPMRLCRIERFGGAPWLVTRKHVGKCKLTGSASPVAGYRGGSRTWVVRITRR